MPTPISSNEISALIPFVKGLTGIVLDEKKAYLFETRLGPLRDEFQFNTYIELIEVSKRNQKIETAIINAITTNETLFFRDHHPFDYIQNKYFPEFFEQKGMNARLHIWSAACSTGQEAYSIAMTLYNILFDLTKYNINILGTDISDKAVSYASRGKYTKFETGRGLGSDKLNKYFYSDGDSWRIRDEIRHCVSFRKMNLLKPLSGIVKQDLIFCRNVAIYFSKEDRIALYERLANQLNEDGILITSGTENLFGLTDRFKMESYRNTFYYRKIY